MRRTVQLSDQDRPLETLIATTDPFVKLEATTLLLKKSVSVRSITKFLDRLPGLAYET